MEWRKCLPANWMPRLYILPVATVMQIAMDILNKRDFPRETILGTSVVDRDNALIMKMQTDQQK